MDAAHFHLALTHLPIFGVLVGIGVLLYGVFTKKTDVEKVGLGIFVLMAIFTIPVFLSGEGAEEVVEHLNGVSEHIIENHEEAAEKAVWLMVLLGVLALFNLFSHYRKYSFTKTVTIITIILSLVTFGVFARVANLGGQIRHTEIRKNGNDMNVDTNKKDFGNKNIENDDDDDDD